MKSKHPVIIIGGGLSGLALAYFLFQKGKDAIVLEASSRPGGRILTVEGNRGMPLELGATWFSSIHTELSALIQELGLTSYPQFSEGISFFQTKSFEPPQKFFIPASDEPSCRIAGGTHMLINTLAERINSERIHLHKKVTTIKALDDGLRILAADGSVFETDQAILCIPPQLAAATIFCTPALPDKLLQILPTVHTWMAGALKFTLEYEAPFWRKQGYSGMLYSHAGIVTEMYDHTNFEESRYGFTGFLNGSAASFSQDVRKELVLRQLGELYGEEATRPTAYFDKVWNDEFILSGTPVIMRPHQNNGHPALQLDYMDGRLHFCCTETASKFPGYMEGAIVAARSTAARL